MVDKKIILKTAIFIAFIIGLVLAVFSYLYLYNKYDFGIPCVFYKAFGLYCPGCGLTRATNAIVNFEFYKALKYNAFSLVLLPVLFFIIVCCVWEMIFNKNSFITKIPLAFWVTFFTLFIAFGIIRNFIPEWHP